MWGASRGIASWSVNGDASQAGQEPDPLPDEVEVSVA
ncbi:hypothetical protein CMMCAS04_12650 [Clavibacter michiganensis subsp. michiganensis]|nr:hypothetical protein CMMCAS04_12650 [Clavibacter michiganensis subsp. michiganensis]